VVVVAAAVTAIATEAEAEVAVSEPFAYPGCQKPVTGQVFSLPQFHCSEQVFSYKPAAALQSFARFSSVLSVFPY
jgi:hypothetical protein